MFVRRILVSLFIILASSYSLLGQVIDFENVYVFEDSSAKLSFSEIVQLPSAKFQPGITKAENSLSRYWIKLDLKTDKEIIEILTPQTEEIDFYIARNGNYNHIRTGHLLPKNTRPYLHKNFLFDIENRDQDQPIFICIKSKNPVGFLFKLQNRAELHQYSTQEYILLGIYYGCLALLILYHAIIFFVIRNQVYLAYITTVLIAGLISLSDDGLGILYIWDLYPKWSRTLGLYILPTIYLIAFSWYSITFFHQRFRAYQKFILWTLIGYLLVFVIQILIQKDQYTFSSVYNIPFAIILGIYIVHFIKTRRKSSIYFIIGFSFSFLGIIINQLRLTGFISGNVFTVYAFNVGIVLEFLSLALSISYKFKEEAKLKKQAIEGQIKLLEEKNDAQIKMVEAIQEKERVTANINAQLEIKVQERTQQLNDLIQKLKNINIEYDKENWQLKRNVKAEKVSKLNQEVLTLKEIRELFPTNYKCFEFLSELKWKNENYTCPKCKNENFSTNPTNLARKCSKCATINSTTKDTIFQSQKIPLNLLFYITYLWFEDHKLNITALSMDLKISESSLYKFVAKLKAQKSLKMKQKLPVNSWKDLIL